VVSLFCYPQAPLACLLQALAAAPTLLLLTPAVPPALLAGPLPRPLRCAALPWLSQHDFDRLLWACDINFVRGEDSFVRAQWAGSPFVWQIYPQHDAAHAAKLQAFLDRMLAGADPALGVAVRRLWNCWNGLQPGPAPLPTAAPWMALGLHWRDRLLAQPDLVSQLLGFVAERR
jgi:uncharacterized repeat protein (TIGR03837 family)